MNMTVKELIEILEMYPENTLVGRIESGNGIVPVKTVKGQPVILNKDGQIPSVDDRKKDNFPKDKTPRSVFVIVIN